MTNFNGYINLMQLNKVQYLNVNGKPSIVIPCAVNDIRVEQRENNGNVSLSALLSIKADEVGQAYRDKERENHRYDTDWNDSKATSHQLVHTYSKAYREKLFERLKEKILKEQDEMTILERMEKVLKRDGSEGHADLNNRRGWEKILWQELDRISRIGRLSCNTPRISTINTAPTAEASNINPTDNQEDEYPF
jgi:hypothetical protein